MTERSVEEPLRDQTQRRNIALSQLVRVREAASKDRKQSFTALLHHVTQELLVTSFYGTKRHAAKGIDGQTWQEYDINLKHNIVDLYQRIQDGSYRPKPARQVYIPKSDGSERALSIQCMEDKIAQQAIVSLLNQIYEIDFKGFYIDSGQVEASMMLSTH